MSLTIRNTKDLLDDPKIREPWPEQFVDWYTQRDPKVADELATVLNEAKNERPLQEFHTNHPYMLALAFSVHCCWVFPKPRLGQFCRPFNSSSILQPSTLRHRPLAP
jgi:hypothetical protein